MGRQMTEAIVAEARVEPGMRVLDVACGTGEPAISLASRLQGSGMVIGSDVSLQPLQMAAQRARERGLRNAGFQQADAHFLPLADGSFDRVTSRLGVMFFSDVSRALAEMRRVLKPGGRVTLLAWGPRRQPYFESTIGVILSAVPGSALPRSGEQMFRFGQNGVLAGALAEAGFSDIEEQFRVIPWSWPGTPENVWEYFQEVTVPFRPLIEAIPAEQRAQVSSEVLTALRRYYDGSQVNFTATICLVSGCAAR